DLYLRQGRYSEAEAQARRALKMEPDYYRGHFTLGESLAAQNLNYEASQEYKQAIQLKPDCAECKSGLGGVYVRLNRDTEAAEALAEAIRLNPGIQYAHASLGLAYFKMGRYTDAIKSYKQAIQLQFEDANAHYGLAASYLAEGSKTAALEEQNIVKNIDQKLGDDLLALINKASSPPPESKPDPVSTVNSQPVKTVTIRELELSFSSNLFDETIRNARIFLETTPNSREAHTYLGLSLLFKRDIDTAVIHLEKAILFGQPITFPVLRLREPLIGHAFDAATVILTPDAVIIKSGKTSYQSNFSALSDFRVENYNNQCPIVFLKGIFTETSENSQKSKQGGKQFNLFPPTATLQPMRQGNLFYNLAACNDDGTVTIGIMKLLNRLMASRR
ncbi:MAG TPA: tetratricopeptide repeat protein, partial [Blastocatellia bacterium]|nr:tetratricopeptide repeat protein [Blastocatellia bacterium]